MSQVRDQQLPVGGGCDKRCTSLPGCCWKKDGVLPLDIVPLFETIEDLANAPAVMKALYNIPVYREHLKHRGNRQTIMLGFSDGTKDGGYLRANWSIFRAKENLTLLSREHGISAIFFDGRGGPPARGGGNTHDFYASLGDTIEDREVQLTIQGQTSVPISGNTRHAFITSNSFFLPVSITMFSGVKRHN